MEASRNPRRSYDKDGSMVQPATVASHRALGLSRVEIWCNDCLHNAEVSTEDLPADFPIPDICQRYRCSQCGSKNLMSRPSVHEHRRQAELPPRA